MRIDPQRNESKRLVSQGARDPIMQRPPAILAIGRNYSDHAAEMGGVTDERPMLFMKNPACVAGNGDVIRIPDICNDHGPQVDYEGELCIEIDRDCRDATVENARSFIRGYRVANDVSARWWQKEGSGGQFCRGKSFDTFCPVSDLVLAADVGEAQSLKIETRLNGVVMQSSSTACMVFSITTLIVELSRGMTLLAGTFILTGTPSGVGAARKPPVFLKDGDVVEIEIERVGTLRNRVEQA